MKYFPKFTEFSRADYLRLDGSQKKQVLKSLVKIRDNGMDTGQPLHGVLWDCLKNPLPKMDTTSNCCKLPRTAIAGHSEWLVQ